MNFKTLTIFLAIIALSQLKSADNNLKIFQQRQRIHEHVELESVRREPEETIEIDFEIGSEEYDYSYVENSIRDALNIKNAAEEADSECIGKVRKCMNYNDMDKHCTAFDKVLTCVKKEGAHPSCKDQGVDVQNETAKFYDNCMNRGHTCWKKRQYYVLTCMDPSFLHHEDFNKNFNKSLRAQNLQSIKKGMGLFCCLLHVRMNCITEFDKNDTECSKNPLVLTKTKRELEGYFKCSNITKCKEADNYNLKFCRADGLVETSSLIVFLFILAYY